MSDSRSIAIVGGGIAGLAAANRLVEAGCRVRVFDKGRGPGGRMSTRRWDDGRRFDHGAQYFTARDPAFIAALDQWCSAGAAALWEGRIGVVPPGRLVDEASPAKAEDRFLGSPGMNAICRYLGEGLDVRYGVRVGVIDREDYGWSLADEADGELGQYDAVILAAPAPQTAMLAERVAPKLADDANAVPTRACWAVMVAAENRAPIEYDGLFVNAGPISWLARNNSKPGRPSHESWVIHGNPEWSDKHIDLEPEKAGAMLIDELSRLTGGCKAFGHWQAHRWRFALPDPPTAPRMLGAECGTLVACGDWCGGPRVEGAYLSGLAAAETLTAQK